MIIVAGGDSFVWGSELADATHGGVRGWSRNTFTAILAREHEYLCAAYPGNGNDSIARTTINACQNIKDQEKFVIVPWTYPGRYEFRFKIDERLRWEVINSWSAGQKLEVELDHNQFTDMIENKAKTLGISEFAKTYFASVGFVEYWEIYSSLKEIVYLQNYLTANNIPYMFTCVDNSIFQNFTVNNPDETIATLYNQINFDNWQFFPAGTEPHDTCTPRGFYQWALENKYSVGREAGHPLEQAHADAAEILKEKFNELVKKNN